jgi:molybdopterin converting factor small subunit
LQEGEAFNLNIDKDFRIIDLLRFLDISEDEVNIIMVNHEVIRDLTYFLNPEDEIKIFPPLGGGKSKQYNYNLFS